jgi:hypothetical protein
VKTNRQNKENSKINRLYLLLLPQRRMEQAFENAPTFEIAFVNIVSPAALS